MSGYGECKRMVGLNEILKKVIYMRNIETEIFS